MIEKSHTHSNDNDVTRVKSGDSNSGLSQSPLPFATSSRIQPINDYTTPETGSISDTGSIQLEIGSVIKETFELVALLGEGGMGTVFKALNKVWEEVEARDPYVAIKVLKPELSANKQLVRSLYSDFDRTKMLANCPNIIKVQGFDRDGPHVYMTMEYLNGQTLGEYLNHTAMSLAQAWFIIEGIGNALAYAHENNIVHRDIKPGNVIITHDGIVKVLDFGIASKINENEGDETKFGGHELGALTKAYASPEMQRDYPPDARDDIYAFACVIYEVLTGKQFYKQKTHKAALIHGLNNRQMEVLNRSLAFERDLRTGSVRELLEKLRPVKTPRLKYAGIGVGVFFILGLVLWGVNELITGKQALVATSASLPPVLTQPVVVAVPAAPQTASTDSEPDYISMSADGMVRLQTSKSEYKSGDPFQLSFTLTQPRYVRVIDRDAIGEETLLRPNKQQPDHLLPAGKEHSFPPKGFNVPVEGPSGEGTVTIVTSAQPFSETVNLLNADGSVSKQVQSDLYSWTQTRYSLRR